MSSLTQTSWLCSLNTTKTIQPSKTKSTLFLPSNYRASSFKILKISAFALDNSKEESLPEPSSSNVLKSSEESKPDRIKLAFERAKKYKKSIQLDEVQRSSKDPVAGIVSGKDESLPGDDDVGEKDIPEAVSLAMEKAGNYQKDKVIEDSDTGKLETKDLSEIGDDGKKEVPEAVRMAMEKSREYKKNKGNIDDLKKYESEQLRGDAGSGEAEVPEAVRIAMAKASKYKQNKGDLDITSSSLENIKLTGLKGGGASNIEDFQENSNKKEDLKISSIDFVGLSFADKKSGRGLPAGLVPVADPFPDSDLQEVEIIVGDASKFGNAATTETEKGSEEESSDLYKPKVSTWGMFPRPSNISETFGGGRTIRPGEALETKEDRAAKEARTRQLLAAYKRRVGINMDPKLKAECEKALNDGDSLMDGGRLKDALPYYQRVMDDVPFQTELHGLAALQWSICQDSLSRSEEARMMYEKLQSHPNGQVSKKARQFMFSFQAMEIMKVTKPNASPRNTGYRSYFEAFVDDKVNYTPEITDADDNSIGQALPYIIFLASPIILVLLAAASKGL